MWQIRVTTPLSVYNLSGKATKGYSMPKRDTRAEIAAAFKESVRKTSLSQTRVADLISELGVNRNTFYYHFGSKYDVAMWIFRTSLAAKLRHDFPESQLVSAPFPRQAQVKTHYPITCIRKRAPAHLIRAATTKRSSLRCSKIPISTASFLRRANTNSSSKLPKRSSPHLKTTSTLF